MIQQRGSREEAYSRAERDPDNKVEVLAELGLRYFSVTEVARLLGFPSNFR